MAGTISGFQLPRRRNSTLKKIFAILLAALFVLSFAASAFAIHAEIPSETQAVVGAGTTQITLGGELRVRGWYTDNIGLNDGNLFDVGFSSHLPYDAGTAAWYDERVRLSVDAKVSPNVEGMVQLETFNSGNQEFSGNPHNDSYVWGNFDSKTGSLQILQAWILYSGSGLLGVPAGMKIGHMPLALGQGAFFDHTKYGDDAIVLFALPTKELEIDALAIKFNEGNFSGITNDPSDDLDGYVGIATYKIDDKNTVGLNYTYLNQAHTLDGLQDVPSAFVDGFNELSFQNLELTGNGNISGLGWKFEGDLQFGNVFTDSTGTKHKAKGYAVMLGLNYQLDPVNIRGMFAYGSGPKNNGDGDINEFVTFLGDDQHYTFVYDYNVQTASLITGATLTGGLDTGFSNTTVYNLGLDVEPLKDVKASLDGYILRASKVNGWEAVVGNSVSKSVGWEIDAKVAYNVAKNLTYEVQGGYMHAGDFYSDIIGADNVENPVVLMHKLTLSF
jgi:hypothetical protein